MQLDFKFIGFNSMYSICLNLMQCDVNQFLLIGLD